MALNICGQCNGKFATDQEYLEHHCLATGFAPTQPEHLGEEFKKIQEEAIKRGEEKKDKPVVEKSSGDKIKDFLGVKP